MKKLLKHSVTCVTLLSALLWCTCSERLAGAGSETTNGIVGCVVNGDGTPASNSTVKLFPSDFNPCDKSTKTDRFAATTDEHGKFKFEHLDPGNYTVIAGSKTTPLQARISNIEVNSKDSVTRLADCILAAPGSVDVDFTGIGNFTSGYCWLPGTDIYCTIDSAHKIQLTGVPEGVYDSLMYAFSADANPIVARYKVAIHPNESVKVNNPGWKYTRTISFNTSVTGADVAKNLFDIPVLLRLNKDNFNFSEARSGESFRFETNDRIVPSEIERWDATSQKAEIWLRIDTLRGNSTGQFITMYWGNETESRVSKNRMVFDTAASFQGVWHLGDGGNDSAEDATVNHYNGGSPDSARPVVTEGIIGNARHFNGVNSFITMPNTAKSKINFPRNGQYTVSAWVYVESPDSLSHVIVSKGNTQYFLWYTSIHLSSTTNFEFADYRDQSGWDLATAKMIDGEWVYVVGVHTDALHLLYVNGERVDTLIDNPFSAARSDQSDLMIGRFAQFMASPTSDEGYCFFKGGIDEVQISGVARSAEWIRLSYKNQSINDKLISLH